MNKIITFNPTLFKTKKLISPKLINKTLIKRIKGVKKQERENPNKFDESNNFLSNVLNNHPKTLKVRSPLNNYPYSPINKSVENILFKPDNSEALNINYKIDTVSPYGNLKRGLKPTLKNWKAGKKITFPTDVKLSVYSPEEEEKRIAESEINSKINGRTEFSTDLLKSFQGGSQDEKITISDEDITIEPEIIGGQSPVDLNPIHFKDIPQPEKPLVFDIDLKPIDLKPIDLKPIDLKPIDLKPIDIKPIDIKPIDIKPIDINESLFQNEKPRTEPIIRIKPNLVQDEPEENRTVKRRYNLGKIKDKGKVGLIISNKNTRKNVSDFIKNMKSTSFEVMKAGLKKQGLIEVGSSAPNEVVRKIYEYSQLAGDVHNENKEILMNNLLNDN